MNECKENLEELVRARTAELAATNAELERTNARLEREIAERTQVEKALRRSEQRYRRTTSAVTDYIFTVRVQDGRPVQTVHRPTSIAVTGYSPEEFAADPDLWLRMVHPDDRAAVEQQAWRILSGGGAEPLEHRIVRKDGATRWVRNSPATHCDPQGRLLFYDGLIRDITERKQAELELAKAKEAAETANRAKGRFLANMSHEIRTPMTAILGFTDVLAENLKEPGNLKAAEIIKRNGQYLLEIINDILDLSKIEAGKLEIERVPCSPCQLVAEVASLMRVRADAKGLLLEVDYQGVIPETIRTDPTRLRQILINLVANATKFTETGSVRIVVRLARNQPEEPELRFDVVDTGIGITQEEIAGLFDPFTQSDSSLPRRFCGTGLGLAISRRLAEMLGGTIEVASSPGEGSTFSATVATGPLDGVRMLDHPGEVLRENEPDRPSPQSPAPSPQPLSCRVLLVEDGPDNQRLIAFLLRKAGAEVTVAENGQIAVDCVQTAEGEGKPFDVILMDIQMPVMDGYAATRKLRAQGHTLPIIALTAHAMSRDRQKCLDAGCDDYMAKPIERNNLLEMVQKHAKVQQQAVGPAAGG